VRSTRHSGFTLLELIIVIAIFAIFSLMAYGGLDSVLNTRRQVELAQDRIAAMQKSYIRLRNDLQQVSSRPARDGFGDVQAALRATDKGYLEFTRAGWRNPLYLNRTGFERVAYRFEAGKLIRSSWRVLDQAQDSKAVDAVLFDDIEQVSWRYFDKTSNEWRDRWPYDLSSGTAQAAAEPPKAVELTMRTGNMGELRFLFRIGLDTVKIPERAGTSSEDTPVFGGGLTEDDIDQTPATGIEP
jgi:general secretion pathway protein J